MEVTRDGLASNQDSLHAIATWKRSSTGFIWLLAADLANSEDISCWNYSYITLWSNCFGTWILKGFFPIHNLFSFKLTWLDINHFDAPENVNFSKIGWELWKLFGGNGMSMTFSNAKFGPAKIEKYILLWMYHFFYIKLFYVIQLRNSEKKTTAIKI